MDTLVKNLKVGDRVNQKFTPNSPIATVIEIIGNKYWFGEIEYLVRLEFIFNNTIVQAEYPQDKLIKIDETK
jgi:hypothetical protein